jgi:colicin import membrane protein
MREREGLIARIRQLRRVAAATDTAATDTAAKNKAAKNKAAKNKAAKNKAAKNKAAADTAATDTAATDAAGPAAGESDPDRTELEDLQRRINDLEQLVQGLQDSVHRESLRLSKRLAELEARTQPAALGAALSKDARERGL